MRETKLPQERGEAERLLDSYDAERRPVIAATLAQALARLQQWLKDPRWLRGCALVGRE